MVSVLWDVFYTGLIIGACSIIVSAFFFWYSRHRGGPGMSDLLYKFYGVLAGCWRVCACWSPAARDCGSVGSDESKYQIISA